MLTGRIDWFGGRNNQTQKINNYGFIIPLEASNTDGIYLHRDDVPVHLQNIIEGKKGKGVYVQFEIDANRNRAMNIELMTFIGTVEWSSLGIWRIECEGRYSVYFKSDESFDSENVITFGLRYIAHNVEEPILIEKIDDSVNDQEILDKIVTSNNFNFIKNFFNQYLLTLPVDCAVKYAIEKLNFFNDEQKTILINKIADKLPNLLLASSKLRGYLKFSAYNLNSYGYFIDKHLTSVESSLKQELLNELIQKIQKSTNYERYIYWKQVKYLQQNLEYHGLFWDIAPLENKKQIIHDKFQTFFDIVSNFNNSDYPYSQAISSAWRELYNLDEIDKTLISKWDSGGYRHPFTVAQMTSARCAEKLVLKFYGTLGYAVEDISSHQVTQKSQTWKQGDVRLDFTDLLDVKNARTSVNSDVYSEFCVPDFKNYRGNDVQIVAVLSPYLKKEEIDRIIEPSSSRANKKVLLLGDFNKTDLRKIENIFSERFFSIHISRGSDTNKYLPHWLFDYNERFYIKQLDFVKKIQYFQNADIPSWEDISIAGDCNPLPLFIAAKRQLPKDWLNNLSLWQITFINDLINLPVEQISLPHLFLSLLRHFLSMLSDNSSDYMPQNYLEILYTNSESNRPLKLYDPLNTIKDFCASLQSLWENREKANLAEFKLFKFNGRGLLQGQRSEQDNNLTTILAYCGGKVEKKGKCGFTPLVIGKHDNCPTCGRLICPQNDCGYCSDKCPSHELRKQNKIPRDNKFYHAW